jgi:hypothetical protein
MSARKHHEIWIEQCVAARTIKTRYGVKAAFDYVVAEKLMNFASAASQHPEFARELPRFVSEVTPRAAWASAGRRRFGRDELYPESPIAASERARQFTTIKEVLTASELGTS